MLTLLAAGLALAQEPWTTAPPAGDDPWTPPPTCPDGRPAPDGDPSRCVSPTAGPWSGPTPPAPLPPASPWEGPPPAAPQPQQPQPPQPQPPQPQPPQHPPPGPPPAPGPWPEPPPGPVPALGPELRPEPLPPRPPPPRPLPRVGPERACAADLCPRQLAEGAGVRFEGLSFIGEAHLGLTATWGDAALAWPRPVPAAGLGLTWTAPLGGLRVPFTPQLLLGLVQPWRDYAGNPVRTHGGALALNLGGLVSVGAGLGHHSTLPVNHYDLDRDGAIEDGELRLGTQRVTPYGFVAFTPVTFARQVLPQLLDR